MSDRRLLNRSPLQAIRMESGKFIPAEGLGAVVENFYPTREGTLRTVWGPIPIVPDYTVSPPNAPDVQPPLIAGDAGSTGVPPRYGRVHGIHHAVLAGRDILLAHVGSQIWEYRGWLRSWVALIGPAPSGAEFTATFPTDGSDRNAAGWPTQFETLPNGIVIVPRRSRAFFYDGDVVVPLGYAVVPGAPQPHGPNTSGTAFDEQNADGYTHDARKGHDSAMHEAFRVCRIGTTTNSSALNTSFITASSTTVLNDSVLGGWLEAGEFRCKRQWIDRHSNLSPLSPASDEVRLAYQVATQLVGGPADSLISTDLVRKQIAWSALTPGPDGTIGQILYRTMDLKNSGNAGYHELPQDAAGNAQAFATIPDNQTPLYTDNIPDVWLGAAPVEPVAVPLFRLCRQAFSRLFIAYNGALRWSMVGRWGTFLKDDILYPDPSAAEITGFLKVAGGLLVFTVRSTYLITPNDTGEGFRSAVVSPTIGCVAPNSAQVLPSGEPIWLAQQGFYVFSEGRVLPVYQEIDRYVRRFTPGRVKAAVSAIDQITREYRCWVSLDGDTENTHCFCFQGQGWTHRTDVQASCVAVTQDRRSYMIAGGEVPKLASTGSFIGVWVLDHESQYFQTDNDAREAIIETSWLNSTLSDIRRTTYKVLLWFVETSNTTLSVEVLRDWRNDVRETPTVPRYPTDDIPAFFGTVRYDSSDTNAKWRRRRPYYTKAEVLVSSAEVVKFRIRGTGMWEFIGLKVMDAPRNAGGHRIPK